MKQRIFLFIVFTLLMVLPAAAQTADFSGTWKLSDSEGVSVTMMMQEQGNSWVGVSRSKVVADMKLNPAGLRNQWVGSLSFGGDYDIKASLKNEQLILTELETGKTWVMTRVK